MSKAERGGRPPEDGAGMTAEEMTEIGEEVFGKYGWQTAMARAIGVDGSTVRRYKAKSLAITDDRASQIRALRTEHRAKFSAAEAAPQAGGWHRRALALIAAAQAAGAMLRKQGRGDAEAAVLDMMGRLVVHLHVADGASTATATVHEGDDGALGAAEERLRALR